METESGNGNDQRKMSDEGYHLNIRVRFYSMMLLCNIVGTVPLKRSKLSNTNRAVTVH